MERRLVLRDLVERGDELRNWIELRRPRPVRWGPSHREPLPERAFLRDANAVVLELSFLDLIASAFGHQVFDVLEEIRMTFHKLERSRGSELFVGIADEHDVARERHPASLDRDQ